MLAAGVILTAGQTAATKVEASLTTLSGATLSVGASVGFYSLTVSSGGELAIHAGGVAADTTIDQGSIIGPGDLVGSTLDSSGLVSGADVTGGTLTDDGLVEAVRVGGDRGAGTLDIETVAYNVRLSSGEVVVGPPDGSVVSQAVVSQVYVLGGELFVGANGVASAAVVSSGGEVVLGGGVASGVTIYAGGALAGSGVFSGSLEGQILDRGVISGASVVSGGDLIVTSGASASAIRANSGTEVLVHSGASATNITPVFGAVFIDDGVTTYTQTTVLAGSLSGSGSLVQTGHGALKVSAGASGFTGAAVISGGVLELAGDGGLGVGISFAAAPGLSARLELLKAPASGGGFAEALTDFASASDQIDLARQAFVAGASATLAGDILTLVDGAYSASFTLSGATATDYAVESDGHSGTLIIADTMQPAALIQHMAAFHVIPAHGPSPAGAGSATVLGAAGLVATSGAGR
jgi:autotransporter passenger strand-loop-strand repeat protein/autotransporter-associated beta strand protein